MTSWLVFDFITVGDRTWVYYFDSDDYSYMHGYELSSFVGEKPSETELIGKMTSADKAAKDAAE